jgi:hypothetical protein
VERFTAWAVRLTVTAAAIEADGLVVRNERRFTASRFGLLASRAIAARKSDGVSLDAVRTRERRSELCFKEWKSYANLHPFDTANPHIAEGLIWASLCAAVLKRFLAHAAQRVVMGRRCPHGA